ncbi:MAG: endonuclease/exonuclease/phosphatase family protein [Planctomycetaceae bacterium]
MGIEINHSVTLSTTIVFDFLGRITRFLMVCGLIGLIGVSVGTLLAGVWWGFDLCTHFRVQYVFVGAILCVGIGVWQKWWMSGICLLLTVFHASRLLPLYQEQSRPLTERANVTSSDFRPHEVTVVSMNLYSRNRNSAAVDEFLEQTKPDIVALIELSPLWGEHFSAQTDRFPYQRLASREGNFGIGIMSRFPLAEVETITGVNGLVGMKAVVDIDGQPLTFLAAHPFPPMGRAATQSRNEQLRSLVRPINQHSGHRVLVGDLNTTSWSPCFEKLLEQTGLRDSRVGFGVQPTWPTNRFVLSIPIDHVLISPEIAVMDRVIGPNIGSDHFPVVVKLLLPTQSED